jgi:hypothetical protein
MKKPTYKDLERKLQELEAQCPWNARAALRNIGDAGSKFTASVVILRLTALGGREVIEPVAIRDGLSDETIAQLKKDIERTMSLGGFNK